MINKKTFIGFIILSIFVLLLPNSYVFANSEQEIKSKLNRIEQQEKEMVKQKTILKQDMSEVETDLNENNRKQTKLKQEIKQIDDELVATKDEINEKETEIKETNERIEDLTDQLDKLVNEIELITERIEKREELIKNRLRSIQENNGEIKFLEVLFGSQSFVDFISRSTAVNTIMDQDQKLIEEQSDDKLKLEANEETIKLSKNEVQEKKQVLGDQKDELVSLQDHLDEQADEKGSLIAELETEYNELEQYRVSIEDEEEAVADQASSLKEAKKLAKQEQKRLKTMARSNGKGNGTFIWPAEGRKSSGYGSRTHPMTKTEKVHHGLDIAASVGTPLKAAGTGVVSVAKAMGGYGNVIMITHVIAGEQITTVYAHLSKTSVSSGETVQQGKVIGATGNSGDSTGPHLHFEVHKGNWNGSKSNSTNPINYLP